jgi:hypothetical protein
MQFYEDPFQSKLINQGLFSLFLFINFNSVQINPKLFIKS